MEINTPEFNEKEFLLGLLAIVNPKFGNELRHIFEYKFDSIDVEIAEYVPTLKKHAKSNLIKKFISQWFAEAAARNLLTSPLNDQYYKFTENGYQTAIKKKNPINYFIRKHWAWSIGIVISVLNVLAAIIIKVVQCIC